MSMNRDNEPDEDSEFKWQLFRVVLFVTCLIIVMLVA